MPRHDAEDKPDSGVRKILPKAAQVSTCLASVLGELKSGIRHPVGRLFLLVPWVLIFKDAEHGLER